MTHTGDCLLKVDNLSISFASERGKHLALEGVSFEIKKGKTLAIVGESGCGKSITALSILRLLPASNSKIETGRIEFEDKDILTYPMQRMREIRGNKIAMIFQEPMTALNPVYTVGQQLSEVFKIHQNLSHVDAMTKSLEMLKKVHIPAPEDRLDNYPFELSGGMRQRVMIAMALACNPDILIADEPTTALDVTIQAQILKLIAKLQKEFGTAVLFITHDLGVVAEIADEVLVMYAGSVIEHGDVFQIYDEPKHPYTKGLLGSIPKVTSRREEKLPTIRGAVPSLYERHKGCLFYDRCDYAGEKCLNEKPKFVADFEAHSTACFHVQGELGGDHS